MKSLKSELQILVVFVGIMLTSFSSNAYGISYMLHTDSLLELQIAKDAPTRINIEGEKINDIFIHPEEAAEVVVHDSGCLFILPQQTQAKLYLTLIGDNGTIQDLTLNFTKSKATPIRLIKFDLEKEVTKLTNNKRNIMNVKKQDVIEKENKKQCLSIIYPLLPVLLIFCVNVILSEVALGETLEGQLDRIGGLSTGKLKTIGISGATILSSIWAVVRGNLRLAGAIVAIGIILGFYLEWVSSGMKIS